ncbi:MAG: cupin domain-containing protein [Vicinamibacterales bacterium]
MRSQFNDPEHGFLGWAEHLVNPSGDVSEWHQHPASETFVYVIRGSLTVRFDVAGRGSVVAMPGDLLRIPAATVHQELTGSETDLEALVVRVGRMPEKVVEPEPVADSQ